MTRACQRSAVLVAVACVLSYVAKTQGEVVVLDQQWEELVDFIRQHGGVDYSYQLATHNAERAQSIAMELEMAPETRRRRSRRVAGSVWRPDLGRSFR